MNHDECSLGAFQYGCQLELLEGARGGYSQHADLEACLVAELPQAGKVALGYDGVNVYFNADCNGVR